MEPLELLAAYDLLRLDRPVSGAALGGETGEKLGEYGPAGGLIWTSIVVDGDHRVYFGGQDGHVYGYAPRGERLFDVDVGGPVDSYPALTADGVLVVGSRNGVLTAIA